MKFLRGTKLLHCLHRDFKLLVGDVKMNARNDLFSVKCYSVCNENNDSLN